MYDVFQKISILINNSFKIEMLKDLPPINASYSNKSHSGSENFLFPFGSKTLEKAKMNIFSGLKNGSCPHLFKKHILFENYVPEKK